MAGVARAKANTWRLWRQVTTTLVTDAGPDRCCCRRSHAVHSLCVAGLADDNSSSPGSSLSHGGVGSGHILPCWCNDCLMPGSWVQEDVILTQSGPQALSLSQSGWWGCVVTTSGCCWSFTYQSRWFCQPLQRPLSALDDSCALLAETCYWIHYQMCYLAHIKI